MDRVAIGIPAYGTQSPTWWSNLAATCGALPQMDIYLEGIFSAGTMAVDTNRNIIVSAFLKSKADWLFFMDADNKIPAMGLRRLLNDDKTLISGMYVLKSNDKPVPVAYTFQPDSTYTSLHSFNPGELLPVDAAGLGCCLIHRSVFNSIYANCEVVQRYMGGIFPVLKKNIKGTLPTEFQHKYSEVISGGFTRIPVRKVTEYKHFPYFVLDGGRTEDYGFFELAHAVGHPLYLDTAVVSPHVGIKEYTQEDYGRMMLSVVNVQEGMSVEWSEQ